MDRLVLTRRQDGSLHAEDSEVSGAEDKEVENVVFDRADAKAVVCPPKNNNKKLKLKETKIVFNKADVKAVVRICLCICVCGSVSVSGSFYVSADTLDDCS